MLAKFKSPAFRRRIIIITILAALALALHFLPGEQKLAGHHLPEGEVPVQPWEGPALVQADFTDQYGNAFNRQNFLDRWTLLFFGFTSCPDVCPMTLALLARVWDGLAEQSEAATTQTRVVMVSVDPDRDTPDVLRAYMAKFSSEFIALRAELETVKHFADPLGVVLQRVDDHDHSAHAHEDSREASDSYDVQHTTAILLVAPDATVVSLFSPPHDRDDLVRRILRIQSEYPL